MEFTCNDPIRGDKIAQLSERLALVLYKQEDDAYFLISGIVIGKAVQLRYDDGPDGHNRMSVSVEDDSIILHRSSVEFEECRPNVKGDKRLANIPKLLQGTTVCDLFDEVDQAVAEYVPLIKNSVCYNNSQAYPYLRPMGFRPDYSQQMGGGGFQHRPTRRG